MPEASGTVGTRRGILRISGGDGDGGEGAERRLHVSTELKNPDEATALKRGPCRVGEPRSDRRTPRATARHAESATRHQKFEQLSASRRTGLARRQLPYRTR
ncbi:hypothetical protein GCM10009646_45370 [Streptomyces aureus]